MNNIRDKSKISESKISLLSDEIGNRDFIQNNNKTLNVMNGQTILTLSFTAVILLISYFQILDHILSFNIHAGINIINFYRGLIYVGLSSFHIQLEKIDLEDKSNFDKDSFHILVCTVILDNAFKILVLLSFKYFHFVNFSIYLCIFVMVKMIHAKIKFKEEMSHFDYAILTCSFVIIAIHFFGTYSESNGYLKGILFFSMSIIIHTIKKKIEENSQSKMFSPNDYVYIIGSGFTGLIFTPIFICFEHADNRLNFYSTILVIIISVVSFYAECLLRKIKKNVKNYKNLVLANLLIVIFLLICFIHNMSILNALIDFSIVCLFLVKFLLTRLEI